VAYFIVFWAQIAPAIKCKHIGYKDGKGRKTDRVKGIPLENKTDQHAIGCEQVCIQEPAIFPQHLLTMFEGEIAHNQHHQGLGDPARKGKMRVTVKKEFLINNRKVKGNFITKDDSQDGDK